MPKYGPRTPQMYDYGLSNPVLKWAHIAQISVGAQKGPDPTPAEKAVFQGSNGPNWDPLWDPQIR